VVGRVAGGALPARDEAVARTEAWVDRLLADVEPAEHRRLLHAYATWRVLRRLRHRSTAAHRPRTPTGLAGLLTELIDTGRRYVGVGAPTASPWLFPGHLPGRPISPARLGERLRTLGIRALPGRRATLLQLAAEVPAAVLADLLHLSVGTATRWTRDAGGDWACYAAELARSGGHGT